MFIHSIVVTHGAARVREQNLSQQQILNGVHSQSTGASECVISITKGFVQEHQQQPPAGWRGAALVAHTAPSGSFKAGRVPPDGGEQK